MGVVKISFSEDCDVVVGGQPDQPDQPMLDPETVGRTNTPFIMADGLHCFGIVATGTCQPLWQVGQVSTAQVLEIIFT